ncbi:MAG: hypothetical protein K8R63_02280 [Bacteroidales bacterium]|nr:hypothetical protein [Bacteroidales bacterium]
MKGIKNLSIFAAITVMALVYSCRPHKVKKPPEINPEFGNYINAFTTGIVSTETSIKIRFQKDIPIEAEPGEVIDADLFEFSPKIRGITRLINKNYIEFKPDKRLISGKTYDVRFNLYKLFDVPDNLDVFEFQFRTIEQSFYVTKGEFGPYDNKNLRKNWLTGYVSTADIMSEDNVQKLLTAVQDGKELPVTWNFEGMTKKFPFVVDSIERKDITSEFILLWDGNVLDINIKGSDTTGIPALSDFKVMSVNVVQQPLQHLVIQFSDPLLENQNLDGIIRFEKRGELKFDIENNIVKAYTTQRISGRKTVFVETSIKNVSGYKMKEPWFMEVSFEKIKPGVRLIGQGTILPGSEGLIFPFEAVNLKAVDLRIIKIFENNIAQFLQENKLDGNYNIKKVGRPVLRKKVPLVTDSPLDLGKWNAFSIDLTDLIEKEPGAIYQVELSFKKEYSLYNCPGQETDEEDLNKFEESNNQLMNEREGRYWDSPGYYWYYYYPDGYNWRERDNPCHVSYFNSNRWVCRNILASNLGIIAKGGSDNLLKVAVTDLRTTNPVSNVTLELYNFQQQLAGVVSTNVEGMAEIDLQNKPFLLVAKRGAERGYLRLDDGSSLSTSMFNVSGKMIRKGIKGFIYGERGVWRPGDTLFLTFILEDKNNLLPPGHPVSFELINPSGQSVSRLVKLKGMNGFYNFTTKTESDAPTGIWNAKVKVGGAEFNKRIRVETVKPNRLKINLDFGVDVLSVADKDMEGNLKVRWLHGAIARNLKANVTVTLNTIRTMFKGYKDYTFVDPARIFYSDEKVIFDGRINDLGEAKVKADLGTHKNAPGMLKANFMVRAFEESGEFSTDFFSLPYAPYEFFIGLKIQKGDNYGTLVTDSVYRAEVVTVDKNGNPVSVSNLKVTMYKLRWRWWWDVSNENLGNYLGRNYKDLLMTKTISTKNGKGNFTFKVEYPDWGRYLIRVEDKTGGHATGVKFYADWPEWVGRSKRKQHGGAAVLAFSSDKEKYNVGEHATITFPTSGKGRALVSIENGSKIVDAYWVVPQSGQTETQFEFKVTEDMCPNVYVYVTYIQPHAQTANDLPIRLYGVITVFVEDPATKLHPVINMPDELAPEKEFTIRVSEQNNKAMTYTIAVVDDGLLDLTRFRTPDPWSVFYAKEALGVKTWDIYDMVLGAYGGKLEKLFAIGGDEEELGKSEQKANRFKPVVMFLGPFEMSGGTKSHTLIMPRYVGSVRTMVIAGNDGAYGIAEKTTPVKNPLMILATLPRVLSPGESVKLPVTVFAMDKKVKNVKVKVEANELFRVSGDVVQTLKFNQTGDKVINFDLEVLEKTGVGKVTLLATSGNEKAKYDIELDVRNPNPPVVEYIDAVIHPGKIWTADYTPVGISGTNEGFVEISGIPPIDFGKRLKYLVSYPYGCSEQITSAVFPQLYLGDVMEIDDRMKNWTTNNIKEAIRTLGFMQLSNGGFRYWPNAVMANDWVSTYIGHFMLEAEKKGYTIPPGFKSKWISYQKRAARSYKYYSKQYTGYYYGSHLAQAYRLYTLALANAPDMGSMNRLRELSNLSLSARWRLAAAYALVGQPEAARELTANLATNVEAYSSMNNRTYGSALRDMAMILETMIIMDEFDKAAPLVMRISKNLSSNGWYSTQTTSYCLLALAKFAGSHQFADDEMYFTYKIDDADEITKRTQLPLTQIDLDIQGMEKGSVKVENKGEALIYVRIMLQGVPLIGNETYAENNLKIKVNYKTINGKPLDVKKIDQGTDFIAEVKVINPAIYTTYSEMALNQIFPSGWEIINTRIADYSSAHEKSVPQYRDIRDDRIYTHFGIGKNPRTYVVVLNAAYRGRFYLPAVSCEAMYDNSINARVPGKWVEVVKPGEK